MNYVCVLVLLQWLFLDQISFETKQKSKYKVDFNFIFLLIEKIFLEKIREPIKTLYYISTMITLQHVHQEIHEEVTIVSNNDKVQVNDEFHKKIILFQKFIFSKKTELYEETKLYSGRHIN